MFDKRFVLHIHGSVHDKDAMILTEADYCDLYYGRYRVRMLEVMKWIFSNPNVVILFIGSGMNELEILQFMINDDSKVKRFFNLSGFYSADKDLSDQTIIMFERMHIGQISFNMDEKGHNQLINVLEHWSDRLNRETIRQSELVKEIKKYTNSKPTLKSKERIEEILQQSPRNIITLCNCLDGKYVEVWLLYLLEVFTPSRFIEHFKKNEYECRIVIIKAERVFDKSKSESVRSAIKEYMRKIISVDGGNISETMFYPDIIGMLLRWPIGDETVFTRLEQYPIPDDSWYNIIRCLVVDYPLINSSDIESVVGLVEGIITIIGKKKSINYILVEFTRNFILNLNPSVLRELFPFFLKMFKEQCDEHFFAVEVGAVSHILQEKIILPDMLLCVWLSESMRHIDKNDMNVLVEDLKSNNHARSTIALNAINLHWNDMKAKLLSLNDFNNLNYSELYDLLMVNKPRMSDCEKDSLMDIVSRSDFNLPDDQSIQAYRYDLLNVLDDGTRVYPNPNKYYDPLQRGKKLIFSTNPYREKYSLKQMDQFLRVLEQGSLGDVKVFDEIAVIQRYMIKNSTEVLNNLYRIRFDPIHYENVLLSFLVNQKTHQDEIIALFEFIIDNHLKSGENDFNTIVYLEQWVGKNPVYGSRMKDIMVKIMRQGLDNYLNSELTSYYEDRVIKCYYDWYVLAILNYLRLCHSMDNIDKDLVSGCLRSLITSEKEYQSGLGLTLCILYYQIVKDVKMGDLFFERIKAHPDRCGILESSLKYVYIDQEIIEFVCNSDIFMEMINDKHNRDAQEALTKLGLTFTYYFIHKDLYRGQLIIGIKNADYCFLRGVIIQIGYELNNNPDEKIDSLMEIITENWDAKEKMSSTYDLVEILKQMKSYDQRVLDLLKIMYGWNNGHLYDDILVIRNLYELDEDQAIELMCALTEGKGNVFFNTQELKDIVNRMIQEHREDERIKRIVNSLYIDHGYGEYCDLLRY